MCSTLCCNSTKSLKKKTSATLPGPGGEPALAIRHALRLQGVSHRVQGDHSNCKATINRRLGHSVNNAGFLVLRDGHSAGGFDHAQTLRAVVTHSGHKHGETLRPEFLGQTLEKNIGGRPMPVDSRLIAQHDDVSEREPLDLNMPASRTDQ